MLGEYALIGILWVHVISGVNINHQDVKFIGMHNTQGNCQTVATLYNKLEEDPWYYACYKRT